jgi:hypothetical protein
MAIPPPIIAGGSTVGFVPAGSLQTELDSRIASSRFKGFFDHMGIALADLTNIGEDPSPGGSFAVPLASNIQMNKQFAVGSLSKIAAMFAAFRLRDRVGIAAASIGSSATSPSDLVAQIMADWGPIISTKIPRPPSDSPNLTQIFNFVAAPWPAAFTTSGKAWNDLVGFHETTKARTNSLKFLDRMRLMIRFSDNAAAGSCVRDIGFQYMNASLAADGFADDTRNGILWLGGDFGFEPARPIMRGPPWDTGPDATWVRANARGIISFLTLMWTNRLVDQTASKEMRDIMLERGVGFATNLSNSTVGQVRAFSKTGILSTVSEGVIVEANSGGRLLRYAGAGLSSHGDAPLVELSKIFLATVGAVHP